MGNKILGYVLLAIGLVLIAGTLWGSYNILTGKTSAPLVFTTPLSANSSTQIQDQLQNAMSQQLSQLMTADAITKFLNFSVWLILAWIFIMGGGAISGIGVKLLNGNK
jgi:hypothetical protein